MAVKGEDDSTFWTSFSDLLTGLFIVTLVLFVVSYERLAKRARDLQINADAYDRLKKMESAIRELQDKEHFRYEKEFKRYVLRRQIQFVSGDAHIKASDELYLKDTGQAIKRLIDRLKADPSRNGVRYLIVIEGMASRDNYKNNFQLSYQRALALYDFWRANHIVFDPDVCEVVIAGSGTEGVGRDTRVETNNQRFLIQIMPKVNL